MKNNYLNGPGPKRQAIFIFLFFLVPFSLYLASLAPGITEGDSAELVGTVHHLGIAHLGYPLFATLGKYMTLFLPFGSMAYRLNIFCALFAGGTTLAAAYLLYNLFSVTMPVLLCVLFLAVLKPIWEQAVATEVYALHLFLMVLWTYLLLAERRGRGQVQRLMLLLFVTGLALGSHHSTVLWAGVYLFYELGQRLQQKSDQKPLSAAFLPLLSISFVTGLAHFLYVPVRASQGVAWNWNYASTWTNLWQLLTAHSFRGEFMHSLSGEELVHRSIEYVVQFYDQCGAVVLIMGLFGLIVSYKRHVSFFMVCLAFFIMDLLYCLFLNEAPLDITPFGLMSKVCLVLLAVIGCDHFLTGQRLVRPRFFRPLIFTVLIIVWGSFLRQGWRTVNLDTDSVAPDFLFNVAATVPSRSVLISEKDEIFYLMYAQTVEKSMPDIVMLHYLNFPRPNQWFAAYLGDHYPDFTYFNRGADVRVKPFHAPLSAIVPMVGAIDRPVVLTFPVLLADDTPYRLVQTGLLYRLVGAGQGAWPDSPNSPLQVYRLSGLVKQTPLRDKYVAMYHQIGRYFLERQQHPWTREYWRKALELDPLSVTLLNNLAHLAELTGDQREALEYYQRLHLLLPNSRFYEEKIIKLRKKMP